MISALSITVSLQKTKKQSQDLHDMVTDSSVMNRYSKDDKVWEYVDSRDLVPGDFVQIGIFIYTPHVPFFRIYAFFVHFLESFGGFFEIIFFCIYFEIL